MPSPPPNDAITQGPILRGLARLAMPMLLISVLQNAQNLIDLFWVGRLGPHAIAAVALSGTVMMAVFPMLLGLSTGTVAIVSRAVGAGNAGEAARASGQSLVLGLVAGALAAAAGFGLSVPILRSLGAGPDVLPAATTYLRILLGGSLLVYLLFLGNAALQGAGDAVRPMYILMVSNVVNIVFDPLLIFGIGPFPRMGVEGAAWATLLAEAVAAAISMRILLGGRAHVHVRWRDLRPDGAMAWRILRIGMAGTGQMLSRSLMGLVLMRLVAGFGTTAVAAYGTGMRFHMIILMPAFALGGAAATMVGQNLGARRPDRARRAAWAATRLDLLVMAASAILLFLFAPALIRRFNPHPEVVAIGSHYLRVVSPAYLFVALAIVLGRALNGAGDTFWPMIFTVASLWGVQVPLSVYWSRIAWRSLDGIWWAYVAAAVLHGALTVGWFQLGRWQRRRV
jgi:putative MATE family efflux protein